MEKDQVRFSQRVVSGLLSLLLITQPVLPAIAATITPSGNTQMDKAGNGVPVVNIATPNQSGISHNKYNDYNVGKEGLILNNATGKLNQTQLGGLIQNNPNLKAGQEAKGIINEVTGTNRSQLQGYTEVAGKAANVIVANPYGITCNGCGFINTPNATLTTGKPVLDANGKLQSLDVTKGSITIEGQGLDGSQSDAVSIIARATEINAALHAKDLTVTAGANRVSASGETTALKGEGDAPKVAVDTGALGGMYANRIHLVSSEKGLGVNLGNLNARQGDITLSSSGKLVVKNSLASGNTTATGTEITLSGEHKAGGNMTAHGQTALTLDNAQLAADKNLQLTTDGKLTQIGGLLTAGVDTSLTANTLFQHADAQAGAGRNLTVSSAESAELSGKNVAKQDATVSAKALTTGIQLTAARHLSLNASQRATLNGSVVAGQQLTAKGGALTQNGSLSATDITLSGQTLNQAGDSKTSVTGNIVLTTTGAATLNGSTVVGQSLSINSASLDNGGMLAAGAHASIRTGTLINNGAIQGNSLDVTGTDITSSGSLKSASVLDIHARNAMLSGNIGAKGNTTVSVSGKLDNGGQMVSDGGMTLTAGQINNHGTFSGASGLSATADIYTAAAASVLHSDGALSMAAGDATLAGETSASGSLAVKGSSLKTLTTAQTQGASVSVDVLSAQLDGTQVAQGALTLKVRDSLLHGGKTSAATLKANGDGITNSGTLQASDVELNAQNLVNTGTLQGRDAFTLQTGTLDNQSGATIAAPKTTINGQRLMNAGMIQGTTLNISAGQQLSNSGVLSAPQLMVRSPEMVNSGVMQGDNVSLYAGNLTSNGTLSSNEALTITADSFNQQGKTGAKGDMQLTVSQLLANSGSLVSDSNLTVTAADLQQNGTLTGATALAVSADTITNGTSSLTQSAGNMAFSGDAIALAGNVWAGGNLTLKGTTLKSAADAQIQSGGNVLLSGNNATMAGVMIAASHMGITTRDSFINSGQLQGASLSVDSAEVVNNGDLSSTGSLGITAKNFIQQGNVGARGNTQLAIDQHLNNSGTLVSDGTLLITAGDVNQSGTLTGAQLLDLTSATLNTTAGSLTQSAGDIGLSSSGAMALAGEIWAEGNLRLTGNTLNSAATALMQSEGSLTMKGQNASLAGTHIAAGELSIDMSDTLVHDGKSRGDTLSIVAPALTNSGMLLASALTVDSDSLTNSGVLQGESTTLQTAIFNNLAGGTLYSGADLTLSVPDITNNGLVNSDGTLTLDTYSLNNTGKLIANALALKTNELKGDGLLQGATAMTLQGDSLTQGTAGRWLTGGLLDIRSGQLSTSGTTQGQSVALNATSWTHEGSLLGLGQFTGTIASILNNSGDILSQGLLALSGDSLTNTGSILAAGLASLSGNQLTNRGAVQGDTLTLKHTAVDNAGTMVGLTGLTLDDKGILTNSGKLLSQGALTVNATDVTNSGSWQGNTLDLTANSLNNSGALQSANALQMALTGDLTSTQNSKITALGEMTLRAAGLNNQGLWSAKTQKIDGTMLNNSGEISGVDGLDITLKDGMQQQGKILTGGSLNVTTTALTNSGQIQGAQSVVNALTLENSGRVQGDNDLTLTLVQALTNHASGTILAQKTLTLATPKLINDGIIQGNGATTFDIKQQVINNGKLLSGAALTLTTADYSGAGWLQATDLILNVAKLANTGTTIAGNQATLKGSSLTNSGTFQAAMLDVNYQTLINRGTLLGNNSLKVTSGALSQDNGKLYSGGDLLIDATTLTGAGDVVAMGNLTAKLIGAFSTQGVMAAGQQLALTSNGDITNQNTLQGNSLTLTAGGKLINNGTLTVGSGETTLSGSQIDLNASGSLQAGGNVTLTSSSDITVKGFTGTAGSLTLNAAGTLLNAALLYAGQNMQLFAARIHNLRGDILAGDSLWMQKDASGAANEEVVNTSGTIETQRGDIAVNTSHLFNTREGYSVSSTQNDYPLNDDTASLTGSDLKDFKDTYDGTGQYFLSMDKFTPDELGRYLSKICFGGTGSDCIFNYFILPRVADERKILISESSTTVSSTGGAARINAARDLSGIITIFDNQASQILAGRNITLSGNTLNNESADAGKTSIYQIARYDCSLLSQYRVCNRDPQDVTLPLSPPYAGRQYFVPYTLTSERIEEYTPGDSQYRAVISAGGNVVIDYVTSIGNIEKSSDFEGHGAIIETPILNTPSLIKTENEISLQSLSYATATGLTRPDWQDMTNSTLQDVNGHNTSLSQDGNAGSTINGGNGSSIAQSGVQASNTDNGTLAQSGINNSLYPLPSGNNGYFVPSTDPDSPYLITVNPKLDGLGQLDNSLFGDLATLLGVKPGEMPRETNTTWTDQNQFLGSSYFLDRLDLNPDNDYRFLGDAAFDTRYASNYLLNQTGSRYINGIGSDLDQMRYLIDSAAEQQKSLGLQFGVALTEAQVASLDKSLIWWESATVNGQTVMVPKVYLSPKDVTVNNGSVISGNNVQLTSNAITNSGSTLTANNSLTLDSSNSISNLNAGLMSAGGALDLSALGDINNVGSTISGKTVQLESTGGSINNLTQAQQWNIDGTSRRGSVSISGTDVGQTAVISATDALLLRAGQDINITGATVQSGGSLAMGAGNDINITANQIKDGYSQSGFRHVTATSDASVTNQGSSITAGSDMAIQAGNNLTVTASNVSAGESALLTAANDLNLNAADNSTSTRNGNSETHTSDVDRTTVSAGDNLILKAGQDINSQAAGLAAENDVTLQAGRDVNLLAEATVSGSSTHEKKKTVIDESVRQQGTEIASGGNTTIVAGQDVNAQAAQVTAQGDIAVGAGRDINLTTATESDYHYFEQTKTKKGFLSKKTTHTIEEDSATREAGTLLSGDNVTVSAGNNLLVKGSNVVGDGDVALHGGNNVDILAATNSDTSWRFKETKKSGLMGSGGIGFTIGSSKTTHDLREAGTTQSESFSTVGSTGGSVAISAGNQAHIGGADIIAQKDLSVIGDSVVIEPGHDKRTRDETFEQKSSGLTVALSGAVGGAINNAVSAAKEAKSESDSRLAALQTTKAALSGYQAQQGVALDAAKGTADGNNNTIGISASLTSQHSKSKQHQESDAIAGSTLNAGNNLSIVANGKNGGVNSGDILIGGSQLKAGGDTLLSAQNDILLSGAANTQKTTGSNSSSGGGVGVGIGVGSGGWGISVFANGNSAHGNEKGDGTEWTETTLDSGGTTTLSSGRDTLLSGAQVSGDKIVADIGRDLWLSSQQDSNAYDSKQSSLAAGGSFTFGSMTGSGYISASQDKMKSTYDSVQEQTGLYAGKGGYDITVGNHTQLDGAVIASTATADKNSLDTGTLGFSDIGNKADYKVSHAGASISGGGDFGGKEFTGNMAGGMASALSHSGHAEGTTQAAVSDGTITIRDTANQQQSVDDLSRDTEHANDSISPIFDKEKEQKRLQSVQLVQDIGSQVSDIVKTHGEINALNAGKAQLAKEGYAEPGADASDEDKKAYQQRLYNSGSYKNELAQYGTGSAIQRAVQGVTAGLTGLAGGNIAGALAGASAPELANLIGHGMGIDENDHATKALAHAILGGVVASLQGNSAAAGAAGGASGELAAVAIANVLYPGQKPADLSEDQKQTVSTLASVSAGIAGGLAGSSTSGAVAGAQAGKNAVENNLLGGSEDAQAAWIRQHGVDMASCADNPGGAACQKAQNERDAVGLALATGTVALLPGGVQAMWGLGAGANAGISYLADGTIDPANVAIAGWTNVFSMGNGLVGTVGWNAAGGALGNWIDDKDPLSGALINGAGSAAGYGIGKGLSWGVNTGANWLKGGWDPKFNPTLQKYTDTKGELGLSKEMTPSNVPSSIGDIGGSITSEAGGKYTEYKMKQEGGSK